MTENMCIEILTVKLVYMYVSLFFIYIYKRSYDIKLWNKDSTKTPSNYLFMTTDYSFTTIDTSVGVDVTYVSVNRLRSCLSCDTRKGGDYRRTRGRRGISSGFLPVPSHGTQSWTRRLEGVKTKPVKMNVSPK